MFRKIISFLLAATMALALAACTQGNTESSADEQSSPQSESPVSEINNESSSHTVKAVNIARGKSYSSEIKDGEFRRDGYGDSINGRRQRLTDGVTASSGIEDGVIAGYTTSQLTVTLDLGEITQNIKTFSIDLYYGVWGIEAPESVQYSYSENGTDYADAGVTSLKQARKTDMGDDWIGADFRLSLSQTVTARYIKITVNAVNHVWSSELKILTGDNGDFEQDEEPVIVDDGVARIFITTKKRISKEDYVSCEINVVDVNGVWSEINDTDALVKVRGNSTSAGAKKPYNIKFSSSQNLLGLGKNKKFCLLANLYDKSLMRNKLSYDFADAAGCHYTVNSTFVDVYLNGTFLGNYMLTQAVDVGEDRVDIDIKDNDFLFEYEPYEGYSNPSTFKTPYCGILLGFNDRDYPTDAEYAWVADFFDKAETALLTANLDQIKKYFDVDSFIDFYIANELFKNVDFATSSTRFYIKDGILYAGPMWDLDLSSGNVSNVSEYYDEYWNKATSRDDTESYYCRKIWYGYLFECDEFKQLFVERYRELQPLITNLTTDNELGKNKIDTLISVYGKSFAANYSEAGWSLTKVYGEFETRSPLTTFEENVEFLRDWLIKRNKWILNNING